MSFMSATGSLSASGLGASNLPPINPADLPAAVRNGDPRAKQAYTEGLEFEQVLVNQLAQTLSATANAAGDATDTSGDSSDSSDSAGIGGGGLLGSGSASSGFSTLVPQALSNSIMSGGGLGIAQEIAQSIDPQLMSGSGTRKSS